MFSVLVKTAAARRRMYRAAEALAMLEDASACYLALSDLVIFRLCACICERKYNKVYKYRRVCVCLRAGQEYFECT